LSYKNKNFIKNDLRGIKICRLATVPFAIVTQLNNQIEYLSSLGIELVIITSNGPELAKIKTSSTLRCHIIEIARSINFFKDFLAFFKILYVLFTIKFDIIHSTTPKAGFLSAIAAYLTRIPVRLHTFTGQPWVTLNKGLKYWTARLADKTIGILNTQCYADSESQRKLLIFEGIITPNKINVIGKGSLAGVDLNRFNPNILSFQEKHLLKKELFVHISSLVIIFIGRISPDKGIRELISVFKKIIDFGYNADLLLVGPNDKDRGGKDIISFDEVKHNSRIHFIGYSDYPERYLAISDILCLPSYREGFGTVVIEAAAMGIPTVGTQINGLIDAVVNGQTGLLVPPANEQKLYDALIFLLKNPDILNNMGKAARERCIKYFDSKIINLQMAEEYKRLLTVK
jgi:glycosyltransferase involved in cell wall biosynthesis